jgi:hypothetical protein
MDSRQSVRIFYPVTRQYLLSSNRLDGLPFPPQYFDFVRASGLGLAIPEDEWQTVLDVKLPDFSASYTLTIQTGNPARYESWGRFGGKYPKCDTFRAPPELTTSRSLKRTQYFLALLPSFSSNSRHPRFTYHFLLPRHMRYRPTSTEVNPQRFMTVLTLHRSKLDCPCLQRPRVAHSTSTENLQADCQAFSQRSIIRSHS